MDWTRAGSRAGRSSPAADSGSRAAASTYRSVADEAWRWVLAQVRWDDGPWIPTTGDGPAAAAPPADRDGMHSGIGGIAHLLAEIRLARAWTPAEARLADAIGDRLQGLIATDVDCTHFDGLVSHLGALGVLGRLDGVGAAVERLIALGDDEGWPQTAMRPPRYRADARINDATLGTAGVLLGAVWAHRLGVTGAVDLAGRAADVLLAERETEPTGTNWLFVPRRFCLEPRRQMPNWSHGLAGIAAALALAGAQLRRADLVEAAVSGAEHLVSLGHRVDSGDESAFAVPHVVPADPDVEETTYSWCHGPTGTSLLFSALDRVGVVGVAGDPPPSWHRRCLRSIRASGLPERLRPGFWDNDGRCCGTAGVAEAFLDSWQQTGDPTDLEFARRLVDALVERLVVDERGARWRFVEHRATDPLLPPGVGWMQGAAGIAAVLFRAARVLEEGRQAVAVSRLDAWWAVPDGAPT
jgi:hypothetical protein